MKTAHLGYHFGRRGSPHSVFDFHTGSRNLVEAQGKGFDSEGQDRFDEVRCGTTSLFDRNVFRCYRLSAPSGPGADRILGEGLVFEWRQENFAASDLTEVEVRFEAVEYASYD